jgi:hypothetical protein
MNVPLKLASEARPTDMPDTSDNGVQGNEFL